jgi:TolA-binding protein
MKTRKRLTKKQLKRDRFVDTTFDWALWARENVKQVGAIAAGLVVVGLAVFLYRTSEARESRQASQKFQEIIQTYGSGNFQLAANDFREFLSKYKGTRYGSEATLYLANSYLQAGDARSAVKTLEEARGQTDDPNVAYAAGTLLGSAYESTGDAAKAAEAYRQAGQKARHDFERAEALMNAARVHTAGKDVEKAVAAYQEVVKKYPDSEAAAEAKVRLAEVMAEPLELAPAASAAAAASVETAATAKADSTAKPGATGAANEPAASVSVAPAAKVEGAKPEEPAEAR